MPIRLTDNLAHPNRGTVSQAMAYAVTQRADRQVFLHEYFTELYRLCAKYQLDFSILVAQSANETGKWKSAIWNEYGNPAGIGVTGSDVSSGPNESLVYENGKDAARAHVVHMQAYVRGAIPENTELYDYIEFDPRYEAVFEAGYDGTIRRIQDFNVNGKWALLTKPPPYGQRIVNDGLAVWPSLPNQSDPPVEVPTTPEEPIPPMAITFGNVPKPPMKVMIVPKGASGNGYYSCPPRHNVGFMLHETQGMSSGEWYYDFFSCPNGERCENALVDFLIEPDGDIYMYNDPEGTRAPWANGGGAFEDGGIEGDGGPYVEYFGIGAVDTKTISCEAVKNHGAPMTAKQIASAGKLFAHYADRDQQPWTIWPKVAKYDNTIVYLNHYEIGTTNCFINDDDNTKVIAAVKANLKVAQESSTTPAPDPDPPTPPPPVVELVPGVDIAVAQWLFGDELAPDYVLSKSGGVLSPLYKERAKASGEWPALIKRKVWDSRVYYQFSNGWVALYNDKDKSIRWIEEAA
jgi:hypothetical protein